MISNERWHGHKEGPEFGYRKSFVGCVLATMLGDSLKELKILCLCLNNMTIDFWLGSWSFIEITLRYVNLGIVSEIALFKNGNSLYKYLL